MSRRNKPLEKKARAMERALRKGRLPRYLNLIEWLKDHKYADTTGKAIAIIKAGRVMSESHTLNGDVIIERQEPDPESKKLDGMKTVKELIFSPHVQAAVRPTLRVIDEPAGADA